MSHLINDWLARTSNLSDLPDTSAARAAMGLSAASLPVTQASHGFAVGAAVYYSVGGAAWVAARASHAATCATHIVTQVLSANSFVVADWGVLTTSGLTPGAWYVVSPTSAGSVVAWSGVATPYVQRCYQAITSTLARICIDPLSVQVGGWTMELNVDRDGLLSSNGWSAPIGSHSSDTDAYGIARHRMAPASGTNGAYLTIDGSGGYAGSIPVGSTDAWEIELDWIPNSTSSSQSEFFWAGASGTSQGMINAYMGTNTINIVSGTALSSSKSPLWTATGQRQVWTLRKLGTASASMVEWWLNGRLIAIMPYNSLPASNVATKVFYLGKRTSASGTTVNYIYAFRSRVGGVMPMPPSARYAMGELRGEP